MRALAKERAVVCGKTAQMPEAPVQCSALHRAQLGLGRLKRTPHALKPMMPEVSDGTDLEEGLENLLHRAGSEPELVAQLLQCHRPVPMRSDEFTSPVEMPLTSGGGRRI